MAYEYRVVPAPARADKVRGLKGAEARFAHTLSELMNRMARDGWEYQRTETLPCEERVGLTGRTTKFQNLLVFRRMLQAAQPAPPVQADIVPAISAAAFETDSDEPLGIAGAVPPSTLPPQGGTGPDLTTAERIAATLSARRLSALAPTGPAPDFKPAVEPGVAPRLGGLFRNRQRRDGIAAE